MEDKTVPVAKWLQSSFEQRDNAHIPREIVFQYYLHMCKRDSLKALPLSSFDRIIRQTFPSVSVSPPGAKKTRMYLNLHVRMHKDEEQRQRLKQTQQMKKRKLLEEAEETSDTTLTMRFLSAMLTKERQRATEDFLAGTTTPAITLITTATTTSTTISSRPASPPLYGPLPTEWLGGFFRWGEDLGLSLEDEGLGNGSDREGGEDEADDNDGDHTSPHYRYLRSMSMDTLGQTNQLLDLMLHQELFS